VLASIVGALLAVPTVAFINSAMRVLLASDPAAEEAELEAQDRPIVTAEADDVAEP
jgi:predicted PurR-regulated permease PerM